MATTSSGKMTMDEAIRMMRSDPVYVDLVRDAYLDRDVLVSAERFLESEEFQEVLRILKEVMLGATLLDLGAGTGIASYALARSGAKHVYALEPDPSDEVGRGAIERLRHGLSVDVLDGVGEALPLPDRSVDIIYARQVLHHIRDLSLAMKECARILKDNGILLACREHVVDDEHQMAVFLANHPIEQLVGGENAYPLSTYMDSLKASGLQVEQIIGPWDSVINAFPAVRSNAELERLPVTLLKAKLGILGDVLSKVPGVKSLAWARIKRPLPGRMYSFLAVKIAS